jgi:hypothetical protein
MTVIVTQSFSRGSNKGPFSSDSYFQVTADQTPSPSPSPSPSPTPTGPVQRMKASNYAGASSLFGAGVGYTSDFYGVPYAAQYVGLKISQVTRDATLPTDPNTDPKITLLAISGKTYSLVRTEQVEPNASADANWLIYSSLNDVGIADGDKFQNAESINTTLAGKNVIFIGGHNAQSVPTMSTNWFSVMRQNRRHEKFVRLLDTPTRIASSYRDAFVRWTGGPATEIATPTALDIEDQRWDVIPTSFIGRNASNVPDDLHPAGIASPTIAKFFAIPAEEAWAGGVPFAPFMNYFFKVNGPGPNKLLGSISYTGNLTGCAIVSNDSRFEFRIESGKINAYLTGAVPLEDYNDASFTITKAGVSRTWTIRISVSGRTTLIPAMRRINNRTMIVTDRAPDGVAGGTQLCGVFVLARESDPGGNPDVNGGAAQASTVRDMTVMLMGGVTIIWRADGRFQLTVKDSAGVNICNSTSTVPLLSRTEEHGQFALFLSFDITAGIYRLIASGGTYASGANAGTTYAAQTYDYPAVAGNNGLTGLHVASIGGLWGTVTATRTNNTPKINYMNGMTGLCMMAQCYVDFTVKANRLAFYNEDSTAANRHVAPSTAAYRYPGMTVDPFLAIAGDAAEICSGSETSPASTVVRGGAWSKNHGTGGDMEYYGFGRMKTIA